MYNPPISFHLWSHAMEATVAERGQITLPKAVRDALGLTKGSVLKVELEGSRIVLSKHVDDAISRVRGKFALDAAGEPAKPRG
jgi:antitoxin PrlF